MTFDEACGVLQTAVLHTYEDDADQALLDQAIDVYGPEWAIRMLEGCAARASMLAASVRLRVEADR